MKHLIFFLFLSFASVSSAQMIIHGTTSTTFYFTINGQRNTLFADELWYSESATTGACSFVYTNVVLTPVSTYPVSGYGPADPEYIYLSCEAARRVSYDGNCKCGPGREQKDAEGHVIGHSCDNVNGNACSFLMKDATTGGVWTMFSSDGNF